MKYNNTLHSAINITPNAASMRQKKKQQIKI